MREAGLGSTLGALMLIAIVLTVGGCAGSKAPQAAVRRLEGGWALRAAAEVEAGGEVLSSPGYDAGSWTQGRVPSTVMAAMVSDGAYPDLYYGTNLERVPTEQFAGAWWYRTELELTPAEAGRVARLVFEGINYSANVWLNGERLATREQVVGAFRVHELDVTGKLDAGRNAVAVEVFPPKPGDPTIGFVDWNPRPPDANMGLWRPVLLRLTGDVSLEEVAVATDVDTATLDSAELRISAVASNHSDREVRSTVTATVDGIRCTAELVLAPGEAMPVTFSPEHYPELKLRSPRLWWPHTLGEPNLYPLRLEAEVRGRVSDRVDTTFGVREVSTAFNAQGHRVFLVNGREVLIRGGGWVDDLLLADTEASIAAQLLYVKHMGLNTIRLEGFWGTSQTLYDLCDREGILIMAGWSCQWEWEGYLGKPVDEKYGGIVEPADMDLVAASLADQVRWLRHHPSVFTWVLASDLLPHPDLERRYQKVLAEADPTRPPLVSCGWLESEVSGPSGVKMRGPYDWVPPVYWYEDRERGGAYGFNTETGPGPQPPPLESLRRMIPPENLWPPDEVWNYHCGRNEFNTINRYFEAVNRRYGESKSVEEFLRKAQVASYEAMRPMFEAFAVNRPLSTGVIQWMLNSAWPEMYWQLYDSYLLPNGAFYGARAACRPLSLAYNYSSGAVHAVNDTLAERKGLTATVRAFDLGAREIANERRTLDLQPGASVEVLSLAGLRPPTPVYFLDLRLADSAGVELARNFYWLPTRTDLLDWEKSLWFVTPAKQFADLTALAGLPSTPLEVGAAFVRQGDGAVVTARLSNPSPNLAFFVELRVVDGADRSFLPVLWEDNYVSLLPGEERELEARLPGAGRFEEAVLKVSGWNVPESVVPLGAAADRAR